jgi:hypothetical protein
LVLVKATCPQHRVTCCYREMGISPERIPPPRLSAIDRSPRPDGAEAARVAVPCPASMVIRFSFIKPGT